MNFTLSVTSLRRNQKDIAIHALGQALNPYDASIRSTLRENICLGQELWDDIVEIETTPLIEPAIYLHKHDGPMRSYRGAPALKKLVLVPLNIDFDDIKSAANCWPDAI